MLLLAYDFRHTNDDYDNNAVMDGVDDADSRAGVPNSFDFLLF